MGMPTAASHTLRLEEGLNNGWGPSDLAPDARAMSESTYRLSADEGGQTTPNLAKEAGDCSHGQPSSREPRVFPPAPLDPLLESWLQELGLGDEVKWKMAAEGITCESLSLLSHAQLQELGVSKMGDRVKVMHQECGQLLLLLLVL
jgi:hypothetical protein